VQDVSAERALSAVRKAIREVSKREIDPADLALWKARLEGDVRSKVASPSGFVQTLFNRYALNKDVTSRFHESISGITQDKVKAFLGTIAAGGCIEYVVL